MNLVVGFAPFILFTLLSRLSADLALWVAFAAAFVVTIRDFVESPSLRLLDAGSFILFALLALVRGRDPAWSPMHRLGRGTSGLVIFARTHLARARLQQDFRGRAIEKRYLALVSTDAPAQGELTTLLGPDPTNPKAVRVYAEPPHGYAKECHTSYKVLERGARFALVELSVERAFRHQIRVHLAHLGYPIAGDAVYGGAVVPELGERHALHGSYIAWAGDAARTGFRAEAGLPAELRALLGG